MTIDNEPKKVNTKLSVIDYEAFEPKTNEDQIYSGREYVGWGENNAYPQYLWELYGRCSTLQSVINGCPNEKRFAVRIVRP